MVAPFKPYTDAQYLRNGDGKIVYTHVRAGFRQAPPYNTPTDMSVGTGSSSGVYDATVIGAHALERDYPKFVAKVANQAYERAVSKMGDGSSFGATATAERKETWAMVVTLVEKTLSSAKRMKSGDLVGALRILGVPLKETTVSRVVYTHRKNGSRKRGRRIRNRYYRLPSGRLVLKTAASGWLLWSYGVKPLCQDIYNGMDVLQRPLPVSERIRSGASDKLVNAWVSQDRKHAETLTYEYQVRWSFEVSVSNPNLFLASKLGLTNPATWILEGITLSFVIDWFSNLSSVVGSFSDFHGVERRGSLVTSSVKYHKQWTNLNWNASGTQNSFWYARGPGSLSPKLVFSYERFSWQRGLNAISLLVGALPGK